MPAHFDAQSDKARLPLGRRLTTLAGSAVENKGNFQDIDVANSLVENRSLLSLTLPPRFLSLPPLPDSSLLAGPPVDV